MRYDRLRSALDDVDTLQDAHAVVVGVGTTGCLSAELLVRAGVDVTLIDHDVVEERNLDAQLLFTEADVGRVKVDVAVDRLTAINQEVTVRGERVHLCADTVEYLDADIVLDCTDNLYTRFVINDYVVQNDIPWVYAGVADDGGMVYVTDGTPCFNCIFGDVEAGITCDRAGVVNAAATMVSSMQVRLAMKAVQGMTYDAVFRVLAFAPSLDEIEATPREDCATCNGEYGYLRPDEPFVLRYCAGRRGMTARPTGTVSLDLDALADEFAVQEKTGYACQLRIDDESVTVYEMGEVEFETENKDVARRLTERMYDLVG